MHTVYYLIYKPFGYLSQFTPEGNNKPLGDLYQFPKDVYPVGRLDADSEGLLILTNDKSINHQLLPPEQGHKRRYWVQVEGEITDQAIIELSNPMTLKLKGKTHVTSGAEVMRIRPQLPDRDPPIRYRKNIPTSWIEIQLTEGKNRQVRKMTAQTGFPTLRLIRTGIEDLSLTDMKPGDVRKINREKLFHFLHL